MKEETYKSDSCENEMNVKIWTHINANIDRDMYHVSQDWTRKVNKKEDAGRSYSFLGLYQKFCEADLLELMGLCAIKNTSIFEEGAIDITSLFASFYGNTMFSILFTDLKILKGIHNKLESMEFSNESNEEGEEFENSNLRQLYKVLAFHEIDSTIENNTPV